MAYNLGTVRASVKTRLLDYEFNDSEINEYINETQYEILGATEWTFTEKIDTETVSGGETALAVPVDYQTTVKILAKNINYPSKPLEFIDPRQFFIGKPDQIDGYYTRFGNNLWIRIAAGTNITIQHLYLAVPTPLVLDTDVPLIPQEFYEILVLGAAARAEQRRGNFDVSMIYLNKNEELIENMMIRYATKTADGAITMGITAYD